MPTYVSNRSITGKSTLRYAVGSANTVIECQTADASLFPTVYPYFLMIDDEDNSNMEIVSVTAATDQALTVTRGQLGTTAVAHPAGVALKSVSVRQFGGGVGGILAVGDFKASAATGGGFALTLTNSGAFRIYSEVTSDLTSAAMVRSILGRTLVNGNITSTAEIFGVVGQLVIKQAKMQHDNAGVLGSIEVQGTAATFSGDIGDTCSAAVLGRVGVTVTATTIEADGILAGIAAMSNVTDGFVTVTSGGIFAALYAGMFASKQKWQYGVFIDEDSIDFCPIAVGKFVSSAGTGGGFAVTLTNSAAMRIYAEVTADLTSAAMVRSILGRMLVNGNITSTAEVFGVVGQLVVKQAKMQHDNAGVLGSLEVQGTAATFSGDIGDTCSAAVLGRVGVTITGTAVEADGVLAGLAAMSNVTDGFVTVTAGGVFAAFYVGRFASKQVWDAGVYIDPTACTIPIQIGVDGAGAKVVIVAGNFADGAASGYGKGSIGIDTTDGLLFYADVNGAWQAIAAAA